MTCEIFETDVAYQLTEERFWRGTTEYSIMFVRSANIATMYIDTESGDMDYIHSKKGNEEKGTVRVYREDGILDFAGNAKSVNGRGNTTWSGFKKKPYSLHLTEEANLLYMGNGTKWILLANAVDHTYMRNKIVYEFADAVGMAFTPDSRMVDLYLNGEYAGVYLLCERLDVHPNRVDLSTEGSYLVSLEIGSRLASTGDPYFVTDAKQALRVHYTAAGIDVETLQRQWQSVENAILAEDGIDPVSGKNWQDLIDLDSWARKYLIDELFGNMDACYASQYFYQNGENADGKIYAGPVWDYDLSMGRLWQMKNPQTMYGNRLQVKNGVDAPWFHALCQKEEFFSRVVALYEAEFRPLLQESISDEVDKYTKLLVAAQRMDKLRWKLTEEYIRVEETDLHDYLMERVDFLNDIWLEKSGYCVICVDSRTGVNFAYQALKPGESLSCLPIFVEDRYEDFIGWYYLDSDPPIDPYAPVYEDTAIYARWTSPIWMKYVDVIAPICVIAVLFSVLLLITVKRIKKGML
jgi:hypothetical protein